MAVLAYIFAGAEQALFYSVGLILHLPLLRAITAVINTAYKIKLRYKQKLLNKNDIKNEGRVICCGITGGIFTGIKR